METDNEKDKKLVLSNLPDVIKYIMEQEYIVDEFFEYCIFEKYESEIKNEFMKTKFDDFPL